MSLVQIQIYDGGDGTKFFIEYDNATLLATRAIFVVPQSLGAPLTINVTNLNLNGGQPFTWQAPPSANPAQYTFSPQLQGVAHTNPLTGFVGVNFGFAAIQFGTAGVSPNAGNTVIHVSPNS